jgi:hypothetical protein
MKQNIIIISSLLLLSFTCCAEPSLEDESRLTINDDIKIVLLGDAAGAKLEHYSIQKHPEDNQYTVTKLSAENSLDQLTEFNVKGEGPGYASIHLLVAKNWNQQCNISIQDSSLFLKPKVTVMPECTSNWRISDVKGTNSKYTITIYTV